MIIPFSDNHERVYWEERSAFPHLRMKRSQRKIQTLGKSEKWEESSEDHTLHCEMRLWDLSKYISDAKSLSCSKRTLTWDLCNGCSEWDWVRVFREKVEERSLQRGLWDLLSKYIATELFEERFLQWAPSAVKRGRPQVGSFLNFIKIVKIWKMENYFAGLIFINSQNIKAGKLFCRANFHRQPATDSRSDEGHHQP